MYQQDDRSFHVTRCNVKYIKTQRSLPRLFIFPFSSVNAIVFVYELGTFELNRSHCFLNWHRQSLNVFDNSICLLRRISCMNQYLHMVQRNFDCKACCCPAVTNPRNCNKFSLIKIIRFPPWWQEARNEIVTVSHDLESYQFSFLCCGEIITCSIIIHAHGEVGRALCPVLCSVQWWSRKVTSVERVRVIKKINDDMHWKLLLIFSGSDMCFLFVLKLYVSCYALICSVIKKPQRFLSVNFIYIAFLIRLSPYHIQKLYF